MIQLILHLLGDYVLQSDWMANNKTKAHFPALAHAVTYSLPFLLLSPSLAAFAVILCTHFLIDRYRLARFVVYAKERLLSPMPSQRPAVPPNQDSLTAYDHDADTSNPLPPSPFPRPDLPVTAWENCSKTGYPASKPDWLAVWLLIAADNTLHLAINYAALTFL